MPAVAELGHDPDADRAASPDHQNTHALSSRHAGRIRLLTGYDGRRGRNVTGGQLTA
jgi:hypothetical protein